MRDLKIQKGIGKCYVFIFPKTDLFITQINFILFKAGSALPCTVLFLEIHEVRKQHHSTVSV